MTKQEEIREGIAKKLCLNDGLDWERLPERGYSNSKDREYYRRVTDSIFQDLHPQGVVVKAKCPDCMWSQFSNEEIVGMTPCYRCNSTGYIFEPLIKEEE